MQGPERDSLKRQIYTKRYRTFLHSRIKRNTNYSDASSFQSIFFKKLKPPPKQHPDELQGANQISVT